MINELFDGTRENKKSLLPRYPFVQQHDGADCGPACLAMISKFHGRPISVPQWRSILSTDHEGTSLFDLAKAAEAFGFVCHGVRIEDLEDIPAEILPCVVHRDSHYLVLYKVESKQIVVGDPALGIRKMTKEDFYKGFSGAVLLLRPTELLDSQPQENQTYKHYAFIFSGLKAEYGLALACSIIMVILGAGAPVINQHIFDRVLQQSDTSLLMKFIGLALGVALLETYMRWVRAYFLEFMTAKIDFRFKSAFFAKALSLPYKFFSVRHVGDFTRRIEELEKVRQFFTANVLTIVFSVTTVAVYLGIAFFYSSKVAFLICTMIPGFFIVANLTTLKLRQQYSEIFASSAEQDGLLSDLLRGVNSIKTSGSTLAARWRFDERLITTVQCRKKFHLSIVALTSLTEGYLHFSKILVLGGSAYLYFHGELTIGQVLALSMFASQILQPVFEISRQWPELQEMKLVLLRLNDVFLHQSEELNPVGHRDKSLRGEIEFKNVWFRYGGVASDWILNDVSFKIAPGQRVAIVGGSGSGKSTIVNLINGLHKPTKGQILIDGVDLAEYDLTWLRSQLGSMFQESHLFYGSIIDNIAFGDQSPDLSRVEEAAKLACAHDFIMSKPNGYLYGLNHGGFGLSSGQKQRIALAKVLYNRPPILLLDEATSSLDGSVERCILANLKIYSEGQTLISVAHRYSSVAACDYVMVVDEGKVVAFDSHPALRNNEHYVNLFGRRAEFDISSEGAKTHEIRGVA